MGDKRYEVRFEEDALEEYNKLDNSVIEAVDKSIDELEERADEVGKNLGNNKNTKLAGCKEIKLRSYGIRIVYRITDQVVDILRVVYILTIEKRGKDIVFKVADKRLKKLKELSKDELKEKLKREKKWKAEED